LNLAGGGKPRALGIQNRVAQQRVGAARDLILGGISAFENG
jgi:hypothetical protein